MEREKKRRRAKQLPHWTQHLFLMDRRSKDKAGPTLLWIQRSPLDTRIQLCCKTSMQALMHVQYLLLLQSPIDEQTHGSCTILLLEMIVANVQALYIDAANSLIAMKEVSSGPNSKNRSIPFSSSSSTYLAYYLVNVYTPFSSLLVHVHNLLVHVHPSLVTNLA